MFHHSSRTRVLICIAALWLAGCGGNSELQYQPIPTPTATNPTPTPTRVPSQARVAGLVVVGSDVMPETQELGRPPENWGRPADEKYFDRALANADFVIRGTEASGTTHADGTFEIPELPPGRYILDLAKTIDGNLIPVQVPLVVGEGEEGGITVEVALGLVRTTTRYELGDHAFSEIHGPYGNHVVLRDDGQIVELGDAQRTLRDGDDDGRFDAPACPAVVAACDPPTPSCPNGTLCESAGSGWSGTAQESRTSCPDGNVCQCVSSCPFCDDCSALVCVPKAYHAPYPCEPDGSCALRGDRCTPACPDCADRGTGLCLPECGPTEIESIEVMGPNELLLGRVPVLSATARLSDGTSMDVTFLVTWESSNPEVATVDSWGRLVGARAGAIEVNARLGQVSSAPLGVRILERGELRQVIVQNAACHCGPMILGAPANADAALPPCYYARPEPSAILPIPACTQVLLVGAELYLTAVAQYADGTLEDVTKQADWQVEPSDVGSVEGGRFSAKAPGTAAVRASFGGLLSDPEKVRVVAEASIESLSIYPIDYRYVDPVPVRDVGVAAEPISPCLDCGFSFTLLRGDAVGFGATARYDTGEWRDVTGEVTWQSATEEVATIDGKGRLTASAVGQSAVTASLGPVSSNEVTVRVVDEATLQSLWISMEGTDRVVAKLDQRFFHANGFYDIGISRDVTKESTWRTSDESIGAFDEAGVFMARAAGFVKVWAELDGRRTEPMTLEVYETSELSYCDPDSVNRAMWSDDFNRVLLESDCRTYATPGVATLRYTVTETQPHGGIFDPCLDLYVYSGDVRVRTIREEGCGDPFLPLAAPGRDEAALKYQLRAFWDLKDDKGVPVAPGTYTIFGRFYLYYDPVVQVQVEVTGNSTAR